LNVKVVASHSGITVGEDGFSHHAIEDIALTCSLPGFTVVAPTDAIETSQVIRMAADISGPFYIRLNRSPIPIIHDKDYRFRLSKAVTMRQGNDATIIATGIMVAKALEAADSLSQQGVDCRVLSMPTLKPLDEGSIIEAAAETGAIITAEEHLEHGGLGSRVAQVLAQHNAVPMAFVAIKDTYAISGKPEELLQKYGLAPVDIVRVVHATILRKNGG
jgi:transketolase